MGDSGMNKARKAMGTNLARVANQKKASKVPMKFADGGRVSLPNKTNPESIPLKRSGGFGSGNARGTGAATKGKRFGGTY